MDDAADFVVDCALMAVIVTVDWAAGKLAAVDAIRDRVVPLVREALAILWKKGKKRVIKKKYGIKWLQECDYGSECAKRMSSPKTIWNENEKRNYDCNSCGRARHEAMMHLLKSKYAQQHSISTKHEYIYLSEAQQAQIDM